MMTSKINLQYLTIKEANRALNEGDYTSQDLTQAHLEAMAAERGLNSFVTECPDRALAMAEESDKRRSKGEQISPLDGIPLAIKD